MRTPLLPLLIWLAPGCAYEAPYDPDADPAPLNAISGTLVFAGDEAPGDSLVLVYDAADPPPPAGTGRPLTFTTVPARAWTGKGTSGLRSAPYTIPYLRDTTESEGLGSGYLISAVVDQDANFHPLVPGLAGATYGDWLGTHVAGLTDPRPVPVFVERGQHLKEITVLVGARVPVQRPVFTTVGEPVLSRDQGAQSLDPTRIQTFRLRASPAHTTYAPDLALAIDGPCPSACGPDPSQVPACPCDPGTTLPSETALWLWFVDEQCEILGPGDQVVGHEPCPEGDGKHDPHPGALQAAAGLNDTWPRVYLEWMDDAPASFEHEGRTLPERWVAEAVPVGLELALLGPDGIAPPAAPFHPFPVQELSVTWSPVFRHHHANGAFGLDPVHGPFDLYDLRCQPDNQGELPEVLPHCALTGAIPTDAVPAGAWQITVVSHTGQTWTLPNEIGDPDLAATYGLSPLTTDDPSFDVATQGRALHIE